MLWLMAAWKSINSYINGLVIINMHRGKGHRHELEDWMYTRYFECSKHSELLSHQSETAKPILSQPDLAPFIS